MSGAGVDDLGELSKRLSPQFEKSGINGILTLGRRDLRSDKLVVTTPLPVGELGEKAFKKLTGWFKVLNASILDNFSFAHLLAENDSPVWTSFVINEDGESGSASNGRQVTAIRTSHGGDRLLSVKMPRKDGLDSLVSELLKELVAANLTLYDGQDVKSKSDDLGNTLKEWVRRPLTETCVKEVLFVPLCVPDAVSKGKRRVVGVLVINSLALLDVETVEALILPYVTGVLAGELLLDEQSMRVEALIRQARAAIMARNMSHNVGSHVLAGITRQVIGERPDDLERLIQYVQERMDFMARVATEWPIWREPVLFFGDLLRGFLKQGLLLDYLIRDDEYEAEDVTFHVQDPEGKSVEYKYCKGQFKSSEEEKRCSEFKLPDDAEPPADFFVAVPGGLVGKQAFFGFLENAIRNAARHNPRCGEGLKVYIRVTEDDQSGFYKVLYWDSVSIDGRNELVGTMNRKIQVPVVDVKTGKLTPSDWGVQEMKAYADFLAHPFTEGEAEWRATEDLENGSDRALRLWAEAVSLQNTAPVGEKSAAEVNVLGYAFGLQRPTMALVVRQRPTGDAQSDVPDKPTESAPGVRVVPIDDGPTTEFLKEVLRHSPGLLYLDLRAGHAGDPDGDKISAWLDWIKRNELALPGRILVRGTGDDQENIEALQLARRVHIDSESSGPAVNGPRYSVVDLYRRWLVAFATERGHRDGFNIVVYFDRPNDTFAKRWMGIAQPIENCYLKELIRAFPCRPGATTSEKHEPVTLEAWTDNTHDVQAGQSFGSSEKGDWLLFLNHGKGRPKDSEPAFEQYIGSAGPGSQRMPNNREAFERLSNVPSGESGVLFLLQLVESCLFRILILDERLVRQLTSLRAENGKTVLGYRGSEGAMRSSDLFAAGVSWVPAVEIDGEKFWIPRTNQTVKGEGTLEKAQVKILDGNVSYTSVHGGSRSKANSSANLQAPDNNVPPFDAVVVHRGLIERFTRKNDAGKPPIATDRFLAALRRLGARVVITSGRGDPLGGPFATYPFIEFSSIENFVIRELSKSSLTSIIVAAGAQGAVHGRG